MSTIEQRKDSVRRFWDEVFNKGNFDALRAMAPGYQYNGAVQDNKMFIGWVQGLRAAMPDLHIVIEDILAEDTKVAVRWHMKGTAAADGMYPKGTKVDWTGTNILVHDATTGLCISNDQNGRATYTAPGGQPIIQDAGEIYAAPKFAATTAVSS